MIRENMNLNRSAVAFIISMQAGSFLSACVRHVYIDYRDRLELEAAKTAGGWVMVDKYCFSTPNNLTAYLHNWPMSPIYEFVVLLPLVAVYAVSRRKKLKPTWSLGLMLVTGFGYGFLMAASKLAEGFTASIEYGVGVSCLIGTIVSFNLLFEALRDRYHRPSHSSEY